MNKQQLAAKIWESANQMRSKIEANEYKDYILGFIFYKYLSDQIVKFAKQEEYTEEDIKELSEDEADVVEHFKDNIGYFICYENLFSTWIELGKDFDVSNVTDALSAFSSRSISKKHKALFDGIFHTLQTGLSKLGDTSQKRTKAINNLIHLIKDIPMDGKQDYDVLGFIYEYLIEKFAANAGKKAGEFYTPHEVSVLMSEIVADHLKDKKQIQIYDPTSGSGSLLINIGQSVAKHMDSNNNIKYYAQELKENTYNLTRMNLVMRGFLADNIVTRNGDTLEDDWPYFDENDPVNSYNPLYVDAVVSNPPYSQKWDSANKESDPRYARFGLAPKTKADYAFLLHDLYHIKPDGIMTIVLPHGVLFRGGEEGNIRKNLIEGNNIDTVIGLPPNIFFGTGIPTIVIVLKQKRENTDILFVDASKGFIKEGKNNKLRASDIKRITDAVIDRESIDKFSRVVSREEIRKNEYNLNIPRYVDSSENSESWDIYASMFGGIPQKEIDELEKYWSTYPTLRNELFTKSDTPYVILKNINVKEVIENNSDAKEYNITFSNSFRDFDKYLIKELIEKPEDVKISKEEVTLCNDIFNRLSNIPLIDRYEAYQLLHNDWSNVSIDLEIIQTEGFDSIKQVDPNMVTKKKNGKEQEVQEGWVGHILPFKLVQEHCHNNELISLKEKENRLSEITSEYDELLDSLTEEEKESSVINEAGDKFINKEITKEAKQIIAYIKNGDTYHKDSLETKIVKVNDLLTEEKALKKEIKEKSIKLHIQTKETIENLNKNQIEELLELKWVTPLIKSLNSLPNKIVTELTNKIEKLSEKYQTNYKDVVEEIKTTEKELSEMINDLTGNEYDMKGLAEFQQLLQGN